LADSYISVIDCFGIESPIATELRRLLHGLKRMQEKEDLKAILFTSATGSEGKSTVSCLLGVTAARKGYKTLVVDCDLRRPTVHKLFALERRHGMVEVLSEGLHIKSAIKKTSLDNLDIITAGKAAPQPTELFDPRAIGKLIHDLKFYYDYVFVDAPPVIPVSDPMLLAQELDAAILVVKAGGTPREVVKRATEILTTNNSNLLGIVLNNVKGSLPYYYDYSHYNYNYEQSPEDRRSVRKGPKSGPDSGPGKETRSDRADKSDPRSKKQTSR